jgi:hypothetical protein
MADREIGLRIFKFLAQRLMILGNSFGTNFSEATQLGVFGFIHQTHAAATEFFQDAIVRDGLADRGGLFSSRHLALVSRTRPSFSSLAVLPTILACR